MATALFSARALRRASQVISIALLTAGAHGADYVGGQTDRSTPQIRLIEPSGTITTDRPVRVYLRYSTDFVYCDDCVAPLPAGYGQLPQVPQQGHAHTYLQRIPDDGGFGDNLGPDGTTSAFCALNQSNPTTEIGPGFVSGECPGVAIPGTYRMCAVLQTDAHVLRVMANPRHFPSIDCRVITVVEPAAGD